MTRRLGARRVGPGGSIRGAVTAFLGTCRLVVRRWRQDAVGLVGVVALIALASSIAVSVPRDIETTLDRGARDAVSVAGRDADLLLAAPVGTTQEPGITTAERLTAFAAELPARLPRSLSDVLGEVTTGIIGPTLAGTTTVGRVEVQIGALDAAAGAAVEPVAGVLPDGSDPVAQDGVPEPTPVVVSTSVSESAGLRVGDTLELASATVTSPVRLLVVGVIDQVEPSSAPWVDLPNVWSPRQPESDNGALTFTALTDAGSFDSLTDRLIESSTGTIRLSFDAARFDVATLSRVRESIDLLETSATGLTEGAPLSVTASSGFEEELAPFATAAAAASAQLSALGAGVFGVSVLLVILAFTGLARRREREIELLRSRGAPLGLIAAHAGVEAAATVLVGVALGAGVTVMVLGAPSTMGLLLIVIAVALAAPLVVPVRQAALADRASARPRILPAVTAAIAVTLAVTAVIALRSREPDSVATVDPLALAAPVFCAAVVAIALSPVPALLLRPLRSFVARTRGAGPLVAITGTGQSTTVLTLTTLTLAVSVAITSLVLAESVATAQDSAAWESVGADVRIDSVSDPDAAVAAFDGTAAAVAVGVIGRVDLSGDGHSSTATLLTVDGGYADVLKAMPDDRPASGNVAAVERLVDESAGSNSTGAADPVPVLLDPRLSRSFAGETVTLEIDDVRVPLTVVDAPFASPGFPTGMLIVVDSAALSAYLTANEKELPETSQTTSVLAVGPGAAAVDVGSGSAEVIDRRAVLQQLRSSALAAGVATATSRSLLATGVLALIGVLLISVLGARRRGRTLALLGTLGVPRRTGIAAAFGELAPLVAAAVLGGAVASAVILTAAGQALGVGDPVSSDAAIDVGIVVPGWALGCIVGVAATALALAVLIDSPLSRRARATTIQRSGEDS